MLFNSVEFIFMFLPLSFLGYFVLSRWSALGAKAFLVGASLFFYAYWNVKYLPLILISIIFNYAIVQAMWAKPKLAKGFLSLGLVTNLALLGYFKYADFFINNFNTAFSTSFNLLHLALPLAISFFTIQQITFLLDSYAKIDSPNIEPNPPTNFSNFLDYALFVTFFPKLIAGPIVHHKEMMPQFSQDSNKHISLDNIASGVFIFSIGLFKKVVIADSLAKIATLGFDTSKTLSALEGWMTSLSYTFQLYFDFSGYTDMAIGVALLFNIRLPQNFNSPYKASSMIEFWQRWHMTLSRFIFDYLYVSIVRIFSQITFHKSMLTIVIAFLIAGLWHGASWLFVFFGLLHGLGVVINHYWSKKVRKKYKLKPLPTWLGWFITFNYVNITLIFFRAKDFSDVFKVLKAMFLMSGSHSVLLVDLDKPGKLFIGTAALLAILLTFSAKNSCQALESFKLSLWRLGWICTTILLIGFYVFGYTVHASRFIYFNF
ncbi:MBOAT family O-acyltransferase [Helicobacter felis]|uniref:Alginate O-acetyltransferase AlgI n=1 Tax=Helicobacter felis (strain ATCC 49179 / CCUG 28539 / NCTC 12436 / CS1) TaxID=936155 RepID=E7AC12_HELFC|nr:MBOAT family O-acyltransferase [Helicobacter felis]CBY82094.1 putative Alginate O-acetyltransferase; AlgI [Helicobacter felis ATCC 49179]